MAGQASAATPEFSNDTRSASRPRNRSPATRRCRRAIIANIGRRRGLRTTTSEAVDSLTHETRQTIRHAGGVALLRILEIASGVLAISLVPRVMGPVVYGQFSLIHTLSLSFSLLSGAGAAALMTHYVPQFTARGDHEGLRKLASGLFALRMLGGTAGALTYFALARFWLSEVSALALALMAASVAVHTLANLPFTVLLGMNRAAAWSLAHTLRRGLMAPSAFAGYLAGGLPGACGGLLAIELLVLSIGLWWGRPFLSWPEMRIDREYLHPYLRFSAAFFTGGVFVMLCDRSGGPLVHWLSGGRFQEAGFFVLAYSAYLTATQALRQILNALGPLFSSLRLRGETEALKKWCERVLTAAALLCIPVAAANYCFIEPAVRLAAGPGYESAAPLLELLGLGGILVVPAGLARVLGMVYNQPRVFIAAASLQLIAFLALSLILFPLAGNRGVALAVVASTGLCSAYATWAIRGSLDYSLRSWLRIVAIGLIWSPLLWVLPAGSGIRCIAFNAAFVATVFLVRILRWEDLSSVWRILREARASAGNPAG